MADREPEVVETTSPASPASAATRARPAEGASGPTPFERAKRHLLLACALIGGGLAVAGTVDRSTGGVLVLIGWLAAVVSLHRLGRTGSDRGSEPKASP